MLKLRTILLVLSLFAFLSASTGGYLYYSAMREAAQTEAERQAITRVELIRKNLSSNLLENIRPVRALSRMDEMLELLVRPSRKSLDRANAVLDIFKDSLEVDVCYLMNHEGDTVASSNRDAPDSFIGKNFAFRPYFQEAMHSAPATYLALGVTSNKRGAYYSYPIFEKGEDIPIGLAVIKASIDQIEKEAGFSEDEIVLVTDPSGVIFISNRKEWLFQSIRKLTPEEETRIAKSRQFGVGPWNWIGLTFHEDQTAKDASGTAYIVNQSQIDHHPGWRLIHLRSRKDVARIMSDPFVEITGPVILALCFLVGFLVFMLYQKASNELLQRKSAERALRQGEERYRSLYHHTPAMLHSIDTQGKLVSVSDYWVDVMGYTREEVIGLPLTDLFTAASRKYAEETVFPMFFERGVCQDIPYQFRKKSGEVIDVLLSAIADRDEDGRISRTLAVSIDVTERNRAEEALRQAKEALGRYSRDLELQVRTRTHEISSLLRYTPAVVYMKDRDGRFTLVNSRFEELFGVAGDNARGKTDKEILPIDVADQFQRHDEQVLEERRARQVEEEILQDDGPHTYLSVKFPIYDETGAASGVCSICTDVTAVKKAQDQLRRLSGSIMSRQEQERAAIARELHDELGQVLTALRMDAVWLRDRLKERDSAGAERAMTMCRLIDRTIEEVRGIAIRLRPGVLDTLGLVDALEWYTTDFERRTEISCIFEHAAVPPVPDTLATAAYRIAQEALTNVARHADAARVNVDLMGTDGFVVLSVSDDGKGFNIQVLSEDEALGVAGMRERAGLVGGDVTVRSRPGEGTRVQFRVPVKGNQRP